MTIQSHLNKLRVLRAQAETCESTAMEMRSDHSSLWRMLAEVLRWAVQLEQRLARLERLGR